MINSLARRLHRGQRGQGATEYAFILVIMAIALIVVVSILGKQTSNTLCQVSNTLNANGGACPTASFTVTVGFSATPPTNSEVRLYDLSSGGVLAQTVSVSTGGASTSVAATLNSTPAVTDFLIAAIVVRGTSTAPTVTGVTDSRNGASGWTVATTGTSIGLFTGTQWYNNQNGVGLPDGVAAATGNSVSPSSGPTTPATTHANDFVVGEITWLGSGVTISGLPAWTNSATVAPAGTLFQNDQSGTFTPALLATSYTYSGTLSAAKQWVATAVAYNIP